MCKELLNPLNVKHDTVARIFRAEITHMGGGEKVVSGQGLAFLLVKIILIFLVNSSILSPLLYSQWTLTVNSFKL